MEYEIYLFCSGAGTLTVFLIIFYHLITEFKLQEQAQPAPTPK
jgi:hypothetical protein